MNKLKKVLCSALCVCMVSVPALVPMTVSGTEDITTLEQQLSELDQKNKEYQDVLDKTKSDINEKEKYKDALVKKVEVLDNKMELTRKKITKLNNSIKTKQEAIDKANSDIEGQFDALSNRLRILYMAGNATDLEIILGAKDFSELIDKMDLIKTLSSYDKELIDGIKVKLDKITEQKKALEEDKATLDDEKSQLKNDQEELNNLIDENDKILRSLYASNEKAQNALESASIESKEIESKIQSYYSEQIKKAQQSSSSSNSTSSSSSSTTGSSTTSGGSGSTSSGGSSSVNPSPSGYVWPVPGFYSLSSEYYEARTGYYHGGIDIAGSGIQGATVVAADSGYVFASNNSCTHNWGKNGSCGCGGGYGNYVMIDHGNGKTTIYGHLTRATVSAGQNVSKGQVIGYVGSTGYSTGPHLHFECRLNGSKYDPMSEYPSMR